MFDFDEELKKLPSNSGVYLMHNKYDEIIYIGKAINLKNRVRQYFQSRTRTPKIEKMISNIAWFEYIVTDSELEALVLESNLIKEHNPKYNTMLKDDKGYPFIRVTVEEDYPRVFKVRQIKRDKSKYFGPYTSVNAVNDIIELLRKLYNIRSCHKNLPKDIGKERPCLYYQINQCKAPCQGYISKEDYRKNIDQVISFLNGNYKNIYNEVENKMKQAAAEMEFEQAAEYRDLLTSINHIADKQKITNIDTEDRDIIAMAMEDNDAVVSLFFVRNGKLIGREHFHMAGIEGEEEHQIITSFIKQYYTGTPYVPKQLLVEQNIDDRELLEEWLSDRRGTKVSIVVPQRGDKHKLLSLAKDNAKMVLDKDIEKLKRAEARTRGAAREIADLIGIDKADRIEAFDISNTSGFQAVASMVVFENGKAKRNDYRKFKLRTVTGPDDYKSMEEVLKRRFTDEKFSIHPDVIMMDGGKGQVNVALKVLDELRITIPICGMVKDDNHRTRGLYYNNEEILFPKNNEAFGLVTRIQDEAHRFAIEYHKLLRGKAQVKSVLDDIKGIGPARRKNLMMHFKDIDVIKNASVEELEKATGITNEVAKEIHSYFH